MKGRSLVFLLIAATSQGVPAAGAPPPKTVELFNGKHLSGWEYVGGTLAEIDRVATIEDGVVSIAGKPNGYIATTTEYAEYSLHIEWRWVDLAPTPGRNGGVLINVSPGPVQQNLWPTSFQVQLKVQRAGDILSMGGATFAETPTTPGTAASPSSTLARHEEASEKALGEWNTADITVRDATIEAVVNGVAQNKVTHCTPASGKIGFQLEGHPFQLRNVRVSPLPPTSH